MKLNMDLNEIKDENPALTLGLGGYLYETY